MVAPSARLPKFKIDVPAGGKRGLTGIGGVLRDHKGAVLCLFSQEWKIRDFNEAEVLAILKALRIFFCSFHGSLVSRMNVVFRHVAQLTNGFADSLAKEGVSRVVPRKVVVFFFFFALLRVSISYTPCNLSF